MARRRIYHLGQRTKKEYEAILKRAESADLTSWSRSQLVVLRAATRWQLILGNADESEIEKALDLIPHPSEVEKRKKVVHGLSENEAIAYENACESLEPGLRAIALLPLELGLRSQEILNLERSQVQRAADHSELIMIRKGGGEGKLPVKSGIRTLFLDLLKSSSSDGESEWETVKEILTDGQYITAYHKFHKTIRQVGNSIGREGLRPHLLRHAFATRLHRDGAPLAAIQWALGHADIHTTMLYLDGAESGGEKFFRDRVITESPENS